MFIFIMKISGHAVPGRVCWVTWARQRLSLTLGVEVHAVDAPLQVLQALVHLLGAHAVATVPLPLDCTEELGLRQQVGQRGAGR